MLLLRGASEVVQYHVSNLKESKMKFVINNLTININLAHGVEPQVQEEVSSPMAGFLAHLLADIASSSESKEESDEVSGTEPDTTDTTESDEVLNSTLSTSRVMIGFRTTNSSTGYHVGDTRKPTHSLTATQISNMEPNDNIVVVVPAFNYLSRWLINNASPQHGFMNLYVNSGNYGTTIHESIAKAEQYADGDVTTVRVLYMPYADFVEATREVLN